MSEKKKILPLNDTRHEKLKHVPFGHEEEFSQAIAYDFLDTLADIIDYGINNLFILLVLEAW